MEIVNILKELHESDKFKEWKNNNPDSYLVHVFLMISKDKAERQVGYCNLDNTITAFEVTDNGIEVNPAANVFQKEPHKIKELDMDEVKTTFKEAFEKTTKLQKEKYPAELPMKKIFVLQNLPIGLVYNITYITQTFKTLNIKINAATGTIMEDSLNSLIQFPQK